MPADQELQRLAECIRGPVVVMDMEEPVYIARISYGKDSLKMLDVIKSRGLPLDRITTTDVWATDTISASLPEIDAFKKRMDRWILERYGIPVEHLCARNPDGTIRSYEQMFYHVPKRCSQDVQVERERERDGSRTARSEDTRICGTPGVSRISREDIKGFPQILQTKWCQKLKKSRLAGIPGSDLSLLPEAQNRQGQGPFFDGRSTNRPKKRKIVEYIGIAADEPKRFGQLSETKRAPLVEFGIDEDLCYLYCKYEGVLSPAYDIGFRDGCWFCHNQCVNQLRNLWANHPDLWQLLLKWDKDSPVSFKADGHTVHDFDRRFRMEAEGLIPKGRQFRWTMLEKPPKFVADEAEQMSLFWRNNG